MKLTPKQYGIICNALRIAAPAYQHDKVIAHNAGHERIADQFERQREEAMALLLEIESNEDTE